MAVSMAIFPEIDALNFRQSYHCIYRTASQRRLRNFGEFCKLVRPLSPTCEETPVSSGASLVCRYERVTSDATGPLGLRVIENSTRSPADKFLDPLSVTS